jgi:hypothetical protein
VKGRRDEKQNLHDDVFSYRIVTASNVHSKVLEKMLKPELVSWNQMLQLPRPETNRGRISDVKPCATVYVYIHSL